MRSVAVCGEAIEAGLPYVDVLERIDFQGESLRVALVRSTDPVFEPDSAEHAEHVLVRVRAFSCNYRDRAILARARAAGGMNSVFPFGSEFAGEVEAVGRGIDDLRAGDRVMADGSWPSAIDGVPDGLPTNSASKERLVVPRAKLFEIPAEMSDEVAASFQIGGQTSYGMVRRLGLRASDKVWVTAARSNTSLFAIRAALNAGARVWVSTTSDHNHEELRALGVEDVLKIDTSSAADPSEPLLQLGRQIGGFDAVIDPLSDLHLDRAAEVLGNEGRYVTCGLYAQGQPTRPSSARPLDLQDVLTKTVVKTLHLLGNCLGTTEDLRRAVADHVDGQLDVTVDSVFEGERIRAFFERTYLAPDRFGKVVFRYS
ncbi:MAG: zinc-binding alcohol dehydrogenase family protein [Acidobacteriota bacterium]